MIKSYKKEAGDSEEEQPASIPDVSLECIDALEQLLKKDPRERITLFDFLHHPWIQTHQKWRNRKIWNDCYSSSSEEGPVTKET